MHDEPLREEDADGDPLVQFHRWFADAQDAGIREANAMAVASADAHGVPSARMVLLKTVDERGFVFFTNHRSRKGAELAVNPRAALLFHWDLLGRQVRVEGAVEPVSREETLAYARSRPRGSQLSALASPQSEPVASRQALESRVAELRERYEGTAEIPVSEIWGGYLVRPERYEFWQHRRDRLHDRLQYTRAGAAWERVRLAP